MCVIIFAITLRFRWRRLGSYPGQRGFYNKHPRQYSEPAQLVHAGMFRILCTYARTHVLIYIKYLHAKYDNSACYHDILFYG